VQAVVVQEADSRSRQPVVGKCAGSVQAEVCSSSRKKGAVAGRQQNLLQVAEQVQVPVSSEQ